MCRLSSAFWPGGSGTDRGSCDGCKVASFLFLLRIFLDALEIHTVGALAELKVSQWLGRKVELTHGTFKDVADCGHDVEVRAVRKEDGKLVIRDNDPTDRRYILTYVSRCSVKLLGWLEGYLALEMGVRANPGGYKEAWFVSQDKLWDMDSFER